MKPDLLSEHPDEMFGFRLLNPAPTVLAPRLGCLALARRKTLLTPNYVPITSRGALPHTTHDVMRDHMSIGCLYVALEDFIEKEPHEVPPVYKVPTKPFESVLRKFIALQDDVLLFMGPRRVPPVVSPTPNSFDSITIMTSVGFSQLGTKQYTEAIQKLEPDIAVGLADVVLGQKPGLKRRERMVDRTHTWTRDATQYLYRSSDTRQIPTRTLFLAPLLPLEQPQSSFYLAELEDEMKDYISGFALYDASSVISVPESLYTLVRMSLSEPSTPQAILREISLGIDLTAVPFIGAASDAGIALDFCFPRPIKGELEPKSLGFDMWSPRHSADMSPLVQHCRCYTCKKHHRAYIRHLLSAKEMLAWTLLQIHNYHTMDDFFADIRISIANGTFTEDVQAFEKAYESELPKGTGPGPRVRGYHLKSEGGDQRKNPKAYGLLGNAAEKFSGSESPVPTSDADADELQARGFAVKES